VGLKEGGRLFRLWLGFCGCHSGCCCVLGNVAVCPGMPLWAFTAHMICLCIANRHTLSVQGGVRPCCLPAPASVLTPCIVPLACKLTTSYSSYQLHAWLL
jgi:hypothetical protein